MLYIRFGAFFQLRGILMSLSGDTIRVALEDCGDAAEFRRTDSGWVSENGEPVEIELRPTPADDPFLFELTPTAVERSSGHYCVV